MLIQKKINLEFFLTILNAYHDHKYFPKKHLQSFSASMLVNYLNKSHQYYLDYKLPELEDLIMKLAEKTELEQK